MSLHWAFAAAAAWPAPVKWVQKPITGELQLPAALAGNMREKVREKRPGSLIATCRRLENRKYEPDPLLLGHGLRPKVRRCRRVVLQ